MTPKTNESNPLPPTDPGSGGSIGPVRRSRLLGGFLIAVFYVGLLAGVEWLAEKLYPRFAPPAGIKAVETLLRGGEAEASGFFVKHPYLFYAFRPGLQAFGRVQFNSLGHRNPEISLRPAPGVLRILCTGGSTTASFPYVHDPEKAWPLRLGAILSERTGRPVEVINAGLHGATSAETLAHYTFRNRYLGAHLVVIEAGGNDGLALHYPNYTPEYTNFTHGWRSGALVPRPGEGLLLKSHLVRWLYAAWLRDLSLETQIGRDRINLYSPSECLGNVTRNRPEGLRRNVGLLAREVRADGAVPVLLAFSWAPDERWRELGDYAEYRESMVLSFEKSVGALREVATAEAIPLIELPVGTLPGRVFGDFCHLNEEGEELKARYLAERLLPVATRLLSEGPPATGGATP